MEDPNGKAIDIPGVKYCVNCGLSFPECACIFGLKAELKAAKRKAEENLFAGAISALEELESRIRRNRVLSLEDAHVQIQQLKRHILQKARSKFATDVKIQPESKIWLP